MAVVMICGDAPVRSGVRDHAEDGVIVRFRPSAGEDNLLAAVR